MRGHRRLRYATYARHGESARNADKYAQGSGDEYRGMPPNDITKDGTAQVRAMPGRLRAARLAVSLVSSSTMRRAIQSANQFVDAHPDPKPPRARRNIRGIKEISQKGWGMIHTREQVAKLREQAVAKEIALLLRHGLDPAYTGLVAWITPFGRGESPLSGGLRGNERLERYDPQENELVFGHAMLFRQAFTIGTHTTFEGRQRLREAIRDRSIMEKVATVGLLRSLRIPDFAVADAPHNRLGNGGVMQCAITESGLYAAGRRIEAADPTSGEPYAEYEYNPENANWHPITAGNGTAAHNE
jgi:broad specificity phosphatase PhoE